MCIFSTRIIKARSRELHIRRPSDDISIHYLVVLQGHLEVIDLPEIADKFPDYRMQARCELFILCKDSLEQLQEPIDPTKSCRDHSGWWSQTSLTLLFANLLHWSQGIGVGISSSSLIRSQNMAVGTQKPCCGRASPATIK